jgi:hypothetical protein
MRVFGLIGLLSVTLCAGCEVSALKWGVFPLWTWRDPANASEWTQFHSASLADLKAILAECNRLQFRGIFNDESNRPIYVSRCRQQAQELRNRIKETFFRVFGDLDSATHEQVMQDEFDVSLLVSRDRLLDSLAQMHAREEAQKRAVAEARQQAEDSARKRQQAYTALISARAARADATNAAKQRYSPALELVDDICFAWRRGDTDQLNHLLHRWNQRYPAYSPFLCPVVANGRQVVDATFGPLTTTCFGVCAHAREEGSWMLGAPEWPPAPKATGGASGPSPVCAKLKSYVCSGGHEDWRKRVTPIVEHSAANGVTASIADTYCADWFEYDAELRSGVKPYISTTDPEFCNAFADKDACLKQQLEGRYGK